MKVGICGYGVIGTGVKKLIDRTKDIKVTKVFDRPTKQEELKELYVNNYKEITQDENIDIVVEAMGGDRLPYEIIIDALRNKKHVVTSNKEVVSLHLNEFEKVAKENNVSFMFEASVGGGIPIINSLIQNRKVNEINHIYGILNGTTNYILTQIEEGLSFDQALKKAQELGFAESDPTADLEGLDMVRKISILADLSFDTFIDINKVIHRPIKGVSKEIIKAINDEGYTLKYICEAKKENKKIELIVEPVAFKQNEIIANIHNEFNMVVIDGETNGLLSFVGKGAGAFPTASAMISDIRLIMDNNEKRELKFDNQYEYVKPMNKEYLAYSKQEKRLIRTYNVDGMKFDFYARIF